MIIDFLERAEYQLADYFAALDQHGRSSIGAGWAGKENPKTWFETAREFTERWHNQQQIRDAVGAASIAGPEYLQPVLSTLVRAVPHWYSVVPSEHTEVEIHVAGPSGGNWTISFVSAKWQLYEGKAVNRPAATVAMTEDTAWRFLTRSVTSREAEPLIEFGGDRKLARRFLDVVAVMVPKELR